MALSGVSNDASVTSLPDTSGFPSRSALSNVGTIRYKASASEINGRSALFLDGSAALDASDSGSTYTRRTLVMVFYSNCCCGTPVYYLWDLRDDWGGAYFYSRSSAGGGAGPFDSSSRTWINGAVATSSNTPNLCNAISSGGKAKVLIWEGSNSNHGNDVTLFARYTFGEKMGHVWLGEFQIYDRVLDDSARVALECGLASKWGISISGCI